jgi:hypothetical protein
MHVPKRQFRSSSVMHACFTANKHVLQNDSIPLLVTIRAAIEKVIYHMLQGPKQSP